MTTPATPLHPLPCDAPIARFIAPIDPTPIDHGGFDAHA